MTTDTGALPVDRVALIYAEQVRHVYHASMAVYPATVIAAAIMAWILRDAKPATWLVVWFVVTLVVSLLRARLVLAYRRTLPPAQEARLWARRFTVGAATGGLCWGTLGSVLLPAGDPALQLLVIFTLIGITTIALFVYAALRGVLLGFSIPIMLPLIVAVLAQSGAQHGAAGMLLILYFGLLLGVSYIAHDGLMKTLTIRFENVELVDELRDSNRRATEAIAGLTAEVEARRRAQSRLLLMSGVTRALADADDADAAMAAALRIIGESLGWSCALAWRIDPSDRLLRCIAAWSVESPDAAAFVEAVRGRRRSTDHGTAGIVRQVLTHGRAVWIEDLLSLPDFARRRFAEVAGLRSALAFPVSLEREQFCIVECFAGTRRAEEPEVLGLLAEVGSLIGQYFARKAIERDLAFVATHDTLTGLPNRAMFGERLSQAIARAGRHQRTLALLFVDLDGFKPVNDQRGHATGDRLLREIADRMRECLREGDTVARQGGDEFVVLIEEYESEGRLAGIAQKVIDAVARPFEDEGAPVRVTASIGISTYPDDATDAGTLLRQADAAMYRAKAHGKNGFQFHAPVTIDVLDPGDEGAALQQALARDEFVILYQPKFDLRTRGVTGAEALIRWRHPVRGLLDPRSFIPDAERSGLIVRIDEWMLRQVCRAMQGWIAAGIAPPRIAVNVSARQFDFDGLFNIVERALADSGLSPERLEIEVTETMFVRDMARGIETLRRLKAIGIRIAIDDFGVGYSSLAYLRRLPADGLKLDRAFVERVPAERHDAAIVRGIVDLAHTLGLAVIAEGVEFDAQILFLEAIGCDEAQGNALSAPLAGDVWRELLARRTRGE
jgi:diguanylate cyclase (GGDEF)-like protein